MNWTTIEPKVNAIKQGILSIMGKIESLTLADKDHLPKLNDSFFNVKKAIQDPSYDVVVCGEVKKVRVLYLMPLWVSRYCQWLTK